MGRFRKALARVIVDSTMQEKAIAHPIDSKLMETARAKMVEEAKAAGIELKQTHAKEGRQLRFKAGRYAHSSQFKSVRKVIKRRRSIVVSLQREVARMMTTLSQVVQETLGHTLNKTKPLIMQTGDRKAVDNRAKLYSWHAPEVECISIGKSCNTYEFRVKVRLAMTLKGNMIVGARSFLVNLYDGHTLHELIEQSTILMQGLGVMPGVVYAGLGYWGVDKDNPDIEIKHQGKSSGCQMRSAVCSNDVKRSSRSSGTSKQTNAWTAATLKDQRVMRCCAQRAITPLAAADDRHERLGPFV